ncbi:BRCT [Penicillium digitatum]|uniref:BRCT n=1 Tax=Penicillium digitatum TaxID=36651 RepID=A0A7T6XFZ1_PENDI|nr:BRCT [Penicillium digitatum]
MAGMAVLNKDYPLTGVVICFTSVQIEKRTPLTKMAEQMGAMHSIHLTSDVTHLLVGDTNSDKYKFVARERNDVVAMNPEWIEAVRHSWTQGEDIDIQVLEKQFRLATLHGLKICITGFSDLPFRAYMQKTTEENGAEYRKDLTKTVTHLIARNSEGEKYKFATQWNIKVVSVKWFTDSIERGMILDEQKYHPLMPPTEQGIGAWNRSSPTEREPLRRDSTTKENSLNPRPRKLRRIASTKLVDQNESIWGDIVGTGFDNNETTGPQRNTHGHEPPEASKPVIQAYQSFASETTFSESTQSRLPRPAAPSKDHGFLHATYFFINGFTSKQSKVLREHLTYNGAQLVDSLNEFSSPTIPKTGHGLFIMVPYQTPTTAIPSTDEMAFECEVVTEMWLERCIDARAFVLPESHVASTPFPKFPIPGFSELRISSTGFGRIDLLHLRKLVELMGATYGDFLTQKASVLICNDPQTASVDKLRHTAEWGVPAVSADWLWISIQTGQKKAFEPYIVRRQLPQNANSTEKLGSSSAKRKQPDRHVDERKAGSPYNISTESTNGGRSEKRSLGNIAASRTIPIVGDGFETDAPKPSVPESRSPTPARILDRQTSEEPNTKHTTPSTDSAPPTGPSALDTALSGLLQQARAAKSRHQSENITTNDDGIPPRRKRKPLLGRAPSHSSAQVLEGPRPVSRASSIDTLNDDGLGCALESAHPTRDNSTSRSNSRAEQSLSSMLSGGKFDFLNDKFPPHTEDEDEENQAPQMTQLDYEDPDAAAMRAEFLRDAGKLSGKTTKADSSGLIVGEVRELEDVGWGSGRRTRKQPVKVDDI